MADIFVSYKREDQEQKGRVIPIVRALEAEGFDVFFDVEIPPGSTWEKVLQAKINMAKCVIVLWSEASVASDWVKEEAEIAKNAGKIIPVFLDRVSAPFGFGRIEGANLVDWDGDLSNVEWQNLIRAVKSRMGEGSKEKRPEVKSVPMPINRTRQSGGSGKGKYAILGILAVVLAAGGFFGYQSYTKSDETGETRPVVDSDEASERKEREAFQAAWTNGSEAALLKFAEAYPDSRYLGRVKDRLEQLAKEKTVTPTPTPTAVPTMRPTLTPVPVPTPTVRPTLKPAPNITLTPVPGRVTESFNVKEDCLTYSGNFTYQGNRTGSGASMVDRERGATPLSASGVSGEAEMKQALSIASHYKLTQQCFVDRPRPPLSYWKTATGDIPAGAMRGEDCTALSASELSVKLRGGMHYVFSGGVSLARFDDEASAKDAVTIMKKYGATHVCYVGRPDPSMTYLRK